VRGTIRIGTRRSALARWQSGWVAAELRRSWPRLEVEVVTLRTLGDRDRSTALSALGRAGVFTKEIEDALLDGRCDVAVHSYKDLATRLPEGLILAAVPQRADPRDALVSRSGLGLDDLPAGSVVGSSSLRRRAQLLELRRDLEVRNLRGNVPTRLAAAGLEVEGGRPPAGEPLDAALLALAGMTRLGLADRASEILAPERFLPAPAQGALALEVRADDRRALEAAAALDHWPSRRATAAERAFLAAMEGGCHAPIGALARLEGDELALDGALTQLDGLEAVRGTARGSDPELTGRSLAAELKSRGGERILAETAARLSEEEPGR
jgi:hydroxymethylbilane synthase